ncbi:helix-turn-helix transcriptional regulator [Promicromonospora thailandica]|uniref:DNA-binding transcriptional regulator YafY, contains an HTH and WYL domains n=1 Tax=Promicromonospora thailandica TaxID=765201 RepID=A0A9X2G717_9MICO|nr:WYL domain-containing protein [Promicromonospora thailandica]MCP2266532.1 putative DNA-binding transcriptional regulator YafY, contains an HTH and WYL domains [Promicromonospora thailandica]BFF17397.1 WYL domain-containing protein [Promicromonospora thailandica]
MAAETSPTARALRTLEVLQTRPGTTAGELADRLGVTERAARRYVGILREAGIPVTSVRGPYGGYRLGRGTRLPPVSFTQAEALGLVMAVLDGHPEADDLVDTALAKVVRALPEAVGRQAATLREHASAAPDRFAARPDTAITSDLVAAVAARRQVRVTYRAEAGSERAAEVDPWAVVVRYGRWYLLCHSHRADAVRTYRVDRVLAVEHTDRPFAPPDGLDPVAALEEHLGSGWRYATRVVFDAPLSDVAPWVGAQMGRLEDAGDRCVLVGSTRNPAMYAQEWLASVPFPFRVEGGPELRAAVGAVAERLAAAVADPPPEDGRPVDR